MANDGNVDHPKTVERLSNILKTTPNLKSISIIQHDEPLILEGQHLAISKNTFKALGLFSRQTFLTLSKQESSPIRDSTLDELSTVLIVLNPDDNKYWNYRKRLCQKCSKHQSDNLDIELNLSSCSLKLKPKCAEPFNHARWLLTNYKEIVSEQTIISQLKMCEDSAELYKHNYYSWTHRLWLVKTFLNAELLEKELEWSKGWIESHISQFCGMNYRFNLLLISSAHQNPDSNLQKCKGFVNEVSYVVDLVLFYPETESLWCYLGFLLSYCSDNQIKCGDSGLFRVWAIDNRFAKRFQERKF